MCGISGIYNFDGSLINLELLNKMNTLIHHRGPDGNGIFTEGNIGIASTRLAILDLRHIADMPMSDFDNRFVIVFNGEIFNYVELKDELIKLGYKFNTASDTEVILNAYKHWGEDCLHKFNGMWAFAIYDKINKTLFCSRDRYGIKPLYFYKDQNKLLFASEIKQLLASNINKDVNDEIVYDYLVFHFIDHTEQTFFKYINKLPAGCKFTVVNNEFKLSKWYNLPENDLLDSDRNIYSELYNLLYDAVRIRLRSDVEVGSCLSGGLDSSAIVCIMHDLLKSQGKQHIQKTFTACYDDPIIDERPFVEQVIKQTNSQKFFLFPDLNSFKQDIDLLTYHQDEPYTGATVFSQWSVFKTIHQNNIKVVLDGQGSDEILIGYFSFYPLFLKRKLINPIKFISEYISGIYKSQLGFNKFSQNFIYFNSPSIRYKHVLQNSSLIANKDFLTRFNRKEIFNDIVAAKNIYQNRLSNLWNISLPSLLRYEDRNSMAFSVEARLPFLDHRLVEFIFSLPVDLMIQNGWTKAPLRIALKNKIPESIRLRKGKLAFSVPQKNWLINLKDFLLDTFNNDLRSGKYIDRNKIINLINAKNFNDKILYRAFALEKWMKIFNLS